MDRAFVYVLRCADGIFYTGITRRSVEERVSEHDISQVRGYTWNRRPVQLIYSEGHVRYDEAVAAERRIKGWSRAKNMAYVRGDFGTLHALSERRGKQEHTGASFHSDAAHPAQDEGSDGRKGFR